jgi:uncharacterized protein with FMN-binding domain
MPLTARRLSPRRSNHRRTVVASVATLLAMTGLLHAKAATRASAAVTAPGTITSTVAENADGPMVVVTHGIVQVSVSFSDGRITNVTALQLPHDNGESWRLSTHAASVLRSEVLSKQSADVDAVTGATYTSGAYLTSVQGALDAASVKAR